MCRCAMKRLLPSPRVATPSMREAWALATSGPGGIHLLNGLYDAKCDGQPVLAITGHTFHDLIGTHFQQDVDLDKVFMDVALYNERIMRPTHVENVVDEAIRTALARRTVSHITIPKDIQEWTADTKSRSEISILYPSGDPRRVLEALIGMIQPKSDKGFLEKIHKSRIEW